MTHDVAHERAIAAWMDTILRDGGIDRYDDLHVDQIDPKWSDRAAWLNAGLESYKIAISLREAKALNLTVALAFSLNEIDKPRGIDFDSATQLMTLVDWSPPSLYLFRKGFEFWATVDALGESVPSRFDARRIFGEGFDNSAGYVLEFRSSPDLAYSRSVFLVS